MLGADTVWKWQEWRGWLREESSLQSELIIQAEAHYFNFLLKSNIYIKKLVFFANGKHAYSQHPYQTILPAPQKPLLLPSSSCLPRVTTISTSKNIGYFCLFLDVIWKESNSMYSFVLAYLVDSIWDLCCMYLYMVLFHGCIVFHCVNKPHVIYPMDVWFIPTLGNTVNSTA